jgi:hypothetical protein
MPSGRTVLATIRHVSALPLSGLRVGRLTRVVVALALGAALTGCGVSRSHTLDAQTVQAQISTKLARQYGLAAGTIAVSCPAQIRAEDGQRFNCRATLSGQSLTLSGVVSGTSGRYTIQPTAAIVVVARAQAVLQSDITAETHQPTTVTCPGQPVQVVTAGGSFSCTATAQGESRQVTVNVLDLKGDVRYTLAAPSSGPGVTLPPQTLPASPGTAKSSSTIPGD